MNERSLKELLDKGYLDDVVFAGAGGYLGESLKQIVAQKYEDLRCGELYYEPESPKGIYVGEKKAVCLWALKNYTMNWLRETIEENMGERILAILGVTESDAKSSCEATTQDKQPYVKSFIVPSEPKAMKYPDAYHIEYISEKGNSMGFVVSGLFVAKENVCVNDLKKYYNAYFKSGKIMPCKKIHSRRPCTYAKLINKEGLNDFLSQKQNTIKDSESGILIAELVYPFVVKLVS